MVVIVRMLQFFDSIVAMTALIATLIFIAIGIKSSGIRRFYVLGMVSFALGLVLSVSGLPHGYNLGLFYGLTGLCLSFSGGLILQRYLRENPLPMNAEHQNG
jgi:hypothetical protein